MAEFPHEIIDAAVHDRMIDGLASLLQSMREIPKVRMTENRRMINALDESGLADLIRDAEFARRMREQPSTSLMYQLIDGEFTRSREASRTESEMAARRRRSEEPSKKDDRAEVVTVAGGDAPPPPPGPSERSGDVAFEATTTPPPSRTTQCKRFSRTDDERGTKVKPKARKKLQLNEVVDKRVRKSGSIRREENNERDSNRREEKNERDSNRREEKNERDSNRRLRMQLESSLSSSSLTSADEEAVLNKKKKLKIKKLHLSVIEKTRVLKQKRDALKSCHRIDKLMKSLPPVQIATPRMTPDRGRRRRLFREKTSVAIETGAADGGVINHPDSVVAIAASAAPKPPPPPPPPSQVPIFDDFTDLLMGVRPMPSPLSPSPNEVAVPAYGINDFLSIELEDEDDPIIVEFTPAAASTPPPLAPSVVAIKPFVRASSTTASSSSSSVPRRGVVATAETFPDVEVERMREKLSNTQARYFLAGIIADPWMYSSARYWQSFVEKHRGVFPPTEIGVRQRWAERLRQKGKNAINSDSDATRDIYARLLGSNVYDRCVRARDANKQKRQGVSSSDVSRSSDSCGSTPKKRPALQQ